MDRKCQVSGSIFTVGAEERAFLNKYGLPLPRKSETERLRTLLSFVPNLASCGSEGHLFYLDKDNGYIPAVSLNSILPSQPPSNRLPDLNGELCFSILADLFNYWRSGNKSEFNHINNYFCHGCSDISDTYFSFDSHHLIECLFISSGKNLFRAISCIGCEDSYFLENCENCKHCLFCVNLSGAEYYVFNQKVGEKEYHDILSSLNLSSSVHLETAIERFANFLKMQMINGKALFSSDVEKGRFLYNGQSSNYTFLSKNVANSVLLLGGYELKQTYGLTLSGPLVEESFQSSLIQGPASGIRNSYLCGPNISELDYCISCSDSNNLMFCVGLTNASYCIFNQQYNKADYSRNRDLLKQMFSIDIDWGIQLPLNFSLVAYNESIAAHLFPLSKAQANLLGFEWNSSLDLFTINREMGNENICEISGESFSISSYESELRSMLGLAKPNRSPNQRFIDLISYIEFGPEKESRCGLSQNLFNHFYRGNRLVVSR